METGGRGQVERGRMKMWFSQKRWKQTDVQMRLKHDSDCVVLRSECISNKDESICMSCRVMGRIYQHAESPLDSSLTRRRPRPKQNNLELEESICATDRVWHVYKVLRNNSSVVRAWRRQAGLCKPYGNNEVFSREDESVWYTRLKLLQRACLQICFSVSEVQQRCCLSDLTTVRPESLLKMFCTAGRNVQLLWRAAAAHILQMKLLLHIWKL